MIAVMRANGVTSLLQAAFRTLPLRAYLSTVAACIAVLSACGMRAFAANPIVFVEKYKVWVLQPGETTYAFGVNERGETQNLYWGKRTWDYPGLHPARDDGMGD
jgi:hypothetical protein